MSFSRFLQRTRPDDAAKFFASPPGRKLVARAESEHEADVHTERAALAARVAEHERQLADQLPGLQKAEDEARAAHAKAKKQADGAAARLRITHDKRLVLQSLAESSVTALRAQLRRSAPPQIEALRQELLQEHQDLREQSLVFDEQRIGWKGRRPVSRHLSNRAAVHRRLTGLLEACRQLEALKETVVDDLPVALKAIRDGIPSADVLDEYTPIDQAIGTAWAVVA